MDGWVGWMGGGLDSEWMGRWVGGWMCEWVGGWIVGVWVHG